MDLIEQAIFTSAETPRASGYQVVAASPGVGEADSRELAAWGPSHDSLLAPGPAAASLNFHPLPSGRYCVSRTVPAGFEYSGRGGLRIYTQCLVVPPEVLARFANNPFALARGAAANGSLRVCEEIPPRLEPLRLAGRAAAVDTALLARLIANPGPEWLATLVQAALDSVTVAIAGGPPAEHLIAGLVNCLPPECRLEMSFSTGLKFCSRRPFRIVALSEDREEQRRVERLYHVAILQLAGSPPDEFAPVESWSRFVHRALRSGRLSFLTSRFARPHGDGSLEDLSALGLQFLEELDATSLADRALGPAGEPAQDEQPAEGPPEQPSSDDQDLAGHEPPEPISQPVESTPRFRLRREGPRRSHAAHGGSATASPPPPDIPRPSQHLASEGANLLSDVGQVANLPEDGSILRRQLERLDELVLQSIAGRAAAVDELRRLWLEVGCQLSGPRLAEARTLYLRYALALWQHSSELGVSHDPERAVQSLDVVCILFAAGAPSG